MEPLEQITSSCRGAKCSGKYVSSLRAILSNWSIFPAPEKFFWDNGTFVISNILVSSGMRCWLEILKEYVSVGETRLFLTLGSICEVEALFVSCGAAYNNVR